MTNTAFADFQTDRMSPQQAAEFLGVAVSTLRNWRHTGKEQIPFVKTGAKVAYRRSDLAEYVARRKRRHTRDVG